MEQLTDFLNQRGLDPELVIGKMGISLTQRNGQPAITIPFKLNGETVNNKYRTFDKQFSQDANATKCFYNQDVINDSTLLDEPLIITEGEFDALSFIQAGHARTVSVPDGAPNETHEEETAKYDYLVEQVANIRKNCPYVIIATDKDNNGDNLLSDLSLRIGRDFCKWMKYPVGCKDANEVLQKHGILGIKKSLETQSWLDVDGVFKASELPPVPEAKIYDIDMEGFNDHMKVRLGDFSVVTGMPGMGKSTFINDVMARIAVKHKVKICFASLEQHPSQDHMRNLKRWYKGRFKGVTDTEAQAWIEKHFVFIYPSEQQQMQEKLDVAWFLEKASTATLRHGCRIVVLDPWNELEHSASRRETLTEYTGRAIKKLKHFAKANNIHMMVAAHPAKMYRNKKDGSYPTPTLYDISDSAHWANKADLGVVVHRESYESDETIIRTAKSRYFDKIGKPGTVHFRFNDVLGRFVWSDAD